MRRDELLALIAGGEDSGLEFKRDNVPSASLEDLDRRRLADYLARVLGGPAPADEDTDGWVRLLTSLDFLTNSPVAAVPTIQGMLLFGINPKRFLPQSGIRALAYQGDRPDYAAREDSQLTGPLVALHKADGTLAEPGLVEDAYWFVRRHTLVVSHLEVGQRVDRLAYPDAAVREAIINALVHRDYSIAGCDVTLTVYSDRLEVESPGGLPNTVTVEGMKAGIRYARNQTLVNVMRDYRYVDFRGMGVREKMIPAMREHNGTEPELIAEPTRFTVRLWNRAPVEA